MRRLTLAFSMAALSLPVSAKADWVSEINATLTAAAASCVASNFQTYVGYWGCFTAQERPVWMTYAPQVMPYYDEFAGVREAAAIKLDAKIISLTEAQGLTEDAKRTFVSRVFRLADELRQQQAAAAEEAQQSQLRVQEARAQQAARDQRVLEFLAAAARANSDAQAARAAASAAAISAQPRITHTTCQPVFGTVQCTTTPY